MTNSCFFSFILFSFFYLFINLNSHKLLFCFISLFISFFEGDDAFYQATAFLRSVNNINIEDDNNDDDYLLYEMEEIVGADGLRYLDDIFTFITLEDQEKETEKEENVMKKTYDS